MSITLDIPSDPAQEVAVSADSLERLIRDIFVATSMSEADAGTAAARLIDADLRGIHSHGSRTVPRYCAAIKAGWIDPRAEITTVRETPAMAVLDGGRGLGHVAASRAMELAIAKARNVGSGTVAVRNSQHFGAASVYPLMAIRAGLIGYATTSTGGATVAAYGSRKPATANNALAWGVPTRRGPPFVLDMACAVSSWGKIFSLRMYGGQVPDGWALDINGQPTADPKEAKTLLPAAGARGYGLAFLSSVLAGPLVGARMPIHKTGDPAVEGSEHFLYALDIRQFVESDEFYDELERTIADIGALEPADGFDKVRLPGELEWERAERWRREGIPLHRDQLGELRDLAASLNVDVAW